MQFYTEDKIKAIDAIGKANWIAFAPVVFQASRSLKKLGILNVIEESGNKGLSIEEIEAQTQVSHYGVRVLCEAGLAIGLLYMQDEKYYLTKTAYFFMHDNLTVANTDFTNDVCYNGLFHLEESIKTGKPEGLKTFGAWKTVYEALSLLPDQVQDSWFKFDHYYSDISFAESLPVVFEDNPKRLLDIGGNTGKFAKQCLSYNPDVHVSIMDLPGQLEMAKQNLQEYHSRMTFVEANILNKNQEVSQGYDAIWLSQFLDCFSDDEIVSILSRCCQAMDNNGSIYILEPFWDRQRFETSSFCLIMTSLYFTSIANGNSQMYRSDIFISLIEKTGLKVEKIVDGIGVSHTLLKCRKS